LDLLTRLVDKSLVVAEGQDEELRYRLLETIRQYAAEKLGTAEEAARVRDRHRDWYPALAEQAEGKLSGPDQGEWLDRLEAEHDNLRLALAWSLDDREQPGAALRLAGALHLFWWLRGYVDEGRQSLDRALAMGDRGAAADRAKALEGLGWILANYDNAGALAALQAALARYRALDDGPGIARTLGLLGVVAAWAGDGETARGRFTEMMALARRTSDRGFIAAWMLLAFGESLVQLGDYLGARPRLEEALALSRAEGDHWLTAMTLGQLGQLALARGDDAAARRFHEESIAIKRALKLKFGIAYSLKDLARLACRRGEVAAARKMYAESLDLLHDMPFSMHLAESLEGCANLAAAQGEHHRAARLFASVALQREATGLARTASDRAEYEGALATARRALGEDEFARARAEGQAMTLEETIAYADEYLSGP
jgi:hypothetical protein